MLFVFCYIVYDDKITSMLQHRNLKSTKAWTSLGKRRKFGGEQEKEYICSMKWLSVILSMYIFSLFVYPCEDVCGAGDHTTKTEQNSSHPDKDHHSDECKGCSPFCVCNCCQVQVLTEYSPMPVLFNTIPTILNSVTSFQITDAIPCKVWEPPKQ